MLQVCRITVDISKRARSTSLCLLKAISIRPQPLPDFELILRIPAIRFSAASQCEVASLSTARGARPNMEKLTVLCGKVDDGARRLGSERINARPINDRHAQPQLIANDAT